MHTRNTRNTLLVFVMTAAAVLAACNEADVQPEETPFTTAELRSYALGDVAPLELGGAMLLTTDGLHGAVQISNFINDAVSSACPGLDANAFRVGQPFPMIHGQNCYPGTDPYCGGFPPPIPSDGFPPSPISDDLSWSKTAVLVVCTAPQPPNGPGQPGPGTNEPPEVFITSPAEAEVSLPLGDQVEEPGHWYADITLTGHGTDPEDGELSGSSLEWKTDRTDLQDELLGTGNSITVRLYSTTPCSEVTHQIRLEARDSDGNQADPDTRNIKIRLSPC